MIFSEEEVMKIKEEIINVLIENTKDKIFNFNSQLIDKSLNLKEIFDYEKIKNLLNNLIIEDDIIRSIIKDNNLSNKFSKNVTIKFKEKKALNSIIYYVFEIISN